MILPEAWQALSPTSSILRISTCRSRCNMDSYAEIVLSPARGCRVAKTTINSRRFLWFPHHGSPLSMAIIGFMARLSIVKQAVRLDGTNARLDTRDSSHGSHWNGQSEALDSCFLHSAITTPVEAPAGSEFPTRQQILPPLPRSIRLPCRRCPDSMPWKALRRISHHDVAACPPADA